MRFKDTPSPDSIPYGYCHCGCGNKTVVPTRTSGSGRSRKGVPARFLKGHNRRLPVPLIETDEHFGIARVPVLMNGQLRGHFAVVDIADVPIVEGRRWFIHHSRHVYYARHRDGFMHRFILGIQDDSDGLIVDHIDGDGLNNRRCNLRTCTVRENAQNAVKRTVTVSPYKGVKRTRYGRWIASIVVQSFQQVIGYFDTQEEAARAYDDAARQHFGEFARLNFPLPGERGAR